jgi:hypothetical protein
MTDPIEHLEEGLSDPALVEAVHTRARWGYLDAIEDCGYYEQAKHAMPKVLAGLMVLLYRRTRTEHREYLHEHGL